MSNKQILWIVSELFPPDETSTSYILGEIAKALSSKYTVKVICGPEVYDKRKKIDFNNQFALDPSIEVFRAKGTNLDKNTIYGKITSFVMMSLRIVALVKRYVKKEDKVLMVTNPAPLVVLMSRLKRRIEFELAILVHDVFPENTKPAGLKIPFYASIKKVFDRSYACADMLIALGTDMANVLERKVNGYRKTGLPKIVIIENWADVNNIVPRSMPNGHIILEYAGNIGRVQGLDKVIQALPKDVELHIYGTGSMEHQLQELNHRNVFFHGSYFRSQQNDVLAACHIALVTLQDGMYGLGVPSKTYNILASGRPVLYFGPRNSEIDILIRKYNIGYCGWPEKWDIKELERMGHRARTIAEQLYAKDIILNKFISYL
jgi:glycosyltransferase involved in cell wall biosynthesis